MFFGYILKNSLESVKYIVLKILLVLFFMDPDFLPIRTQDKNPIRIQTKGPGSKTMVQRTPILLLSIRIRINFPEPH